ncbi:MAG: hypothetical protein KME48_16850 [Candidatus Thiodiazotropha sp. (ex Ctena orbiculata)]|nr:hypothetical protein [Candidatus Thiodiazotropha taylori]
MCSEDFTREKTCYEQNFLQARSLNSQMNQVPVLAMTLTGGLWFAAGVTENIAPEIRFLLLIFAGFCNLALILVTIRTRDVFHSYLECIKAFHPASFASGKPIDPKVPFLCDYSMISIYCTLMLIAATLSFISAFSKFWPWLTVSRWAGIVVLALVLLMLYDYLIRHKVLGR